MVFGGSVTRANTALVGPSLLSLDSTDNKPVMVVAAGPEMADVLDSDLPLLR
jgi:hypothetical protein